MCRSPIWLGGTPIGGRITIRGDRSGRGGSWWALGGAVAEGADGGSARGVGEAGVFDGALGFPWLSRASRIDVFGEAPGLAPGASFAAEGSLSEAFVAPLMVGSNLSTGLPLFGDRPCGAGVLRAADLRGDRLAP